MAFLLTVFSIGLSGQEKQTISGTLQDEESNEALPFASVVARNSGDSTIIEGTTTDLQGSFTFDIQSDNFYITFSSLGYVDQVISQVDPQAKNLNLGVIQLSKDAQQLQEVDVTAERSVVEFQLDKKVFNVGKDIASSGLGALDVLNNVPSVNVDIEGQISLRGNTGVQILINGKPSVLSDEGSTALGTITSDMIDRIEVITNPSAKYEAEGSSGIINIVLKKQEKKGFNGSISLNTGVPANHSIGVSLNRRTEHFNLFTQFGAGYRSLPSYRKSRNLDYTDSSRVESEGIEYRNERFFNITLGTDYHIDKNNVLTLSGSFAFEDEDQPSETDFNIIDGEGDVVSAYQRTEETTAENPKYQYDLQYEKQFKSHEDHILQLSTTGNFFGKDQRSEFTNEVESGDLLDPDQRTATSFFQRDFIHKVDYVLPFGKVWTLETGGQYEINDVGNDFSVSNQLADGSFEIDSGLTNDFSFDQTVIGTYLSIAYEGEKWGAKAGARVENTELNTFLANTEERNTQNYTNLFPSFHTSYKVNKQFSVQAGFSRRIYRPRLWDLNPFFNVRNNYNIRLGNPALLPEFADSYELTAIFIKEKWSVNASLYNLYTTDVIERVTYQIDNVNYTRPENIGVRNQTGIELNGKYTPIDWFSINGDFNYGWFIRNGSFEEQNFDFNGRQWFTRMTGRFKLPAQFELEVSGEYQSEYENIQGEVSGFAFMDVGLRKKLWKGKGVLNLGVRDLFASRIRESVALQPTFSAYSFSQRGRFITLGFSYSFGKGEAMQYTGRRK